MVQAYLKGLAEQEMKVSPNSVLELKELSDKILKQR
jgi:hypothetical protein